MRSLLGAVQPSVDREDVTRCGVGAVARSSPRLRPALRAVGSLVEMAERGEPYSDDAELAAA